MVFLKTKGLSLRETLKILNIDIFIDIFDPIKLSGKK